MEKRNVPEGEGRDDILVPLTSSLYVKGKFADREKVLVDVGTGFYVEKVGGIASLLCATEGVMGRKMLIVVL